MTYIPPSSSSTKFTCIHCSAITQHHWSKATAEHYRQGLDPEIEIELCTNCLGYTIWYRKDLIWPNRGIAPPPNPDMPEAVSQCYQEAAGICAFSPRGAAALLRLALQILCQELGESGKNINKDIAALVKRGLPPRVQQALDIVRVTGNNAVHPGQIDTDSADVVSTLFSLLNLVVEYMITMPKQVSGLYDSLPQSSLDAIAKRDS